MPEARLEDVRIEVRSPFSGPLLAPAELTRPERILRVRPRMRFTGHFESEVLAPAVTHPTRRSGVLGRRSRFAA
jgi:hypothetical protein